MSINEVSVKYNAKDGHIIYGKFMKTNSKKLVFHVHGMTVSYYDLLEVTSAEFFAENGYDHFRIGLYPSALRDSNSRTSMEVNIDQHVEDIRTVLEEVSKEYDEIYLTGHSLGGLCQIIGNFPNLKATSLWDPSLDVIRLWEKFNFIEPHGDDHYLIHYGNDIIYSKQMIEGLKAYPSEVCQKLAKKITTPTQIIIPEAWTVFSLNKDVTPESIAQIISAESEVIRLENAMHRFSGAYHRQDLFNATLKWFNKF